MRIRSLSLTNFRSYAHLELSLPECPLLLYGANAQGKTSVLEAVYLLAVGSSPLASLDRQLINWEAETQGLPFARVWAEVARGSGVHEIEIILEKHTLSNGSARMQKTIRVDGARGRRADLAGMLNVVLFLPQDVELVSGTPSVRRRFVDDALCQVYKAYGSALERYVDALRQRNAALRHLRSDGGDPTQLSPFEAVLARTGTSIVLRRRRAIASLSRQADRMHHRMSGRLESLRLRYEPNFVAPSLSRRDGEVERKALCRDATDREIEASVAAFREALIMRRTEEIARGATLTGPHRDEVRFIVGSSGPGAHDVDLGVYGSRGQQRTAVLSLKLAELAWMHEQTKEAPVLLLDEVLSELDIVRRRHVLAQAYTIEQALLTATDLEMFDREFLRRASLWEVQGGVVSARGAAQHT